MGREGLKGGMTRLFFLSSLLVFFFSFYRFIWLDTVGGPSVSSSMVGCAFGLGQDFVVAAFTTRDTTGIALPCFFLFRVGVGLL